MILDAMKGGARDTCDADGGGDAQAGLKKLKENTWLWGAAFSCITPGNIWKARLLNFVVSPLHAQYCTRLDKSARPRSSAAKLHQ